MTTTIFNELLLAKFTAVRSVNTLSSIRGRVRGLNIKQSCVRQITTGEYIYIFIWLLPGLSAEGKQKLTGNRLATQTTKK